MSEAPEFFVCVEGAKACACSCGRSFVIGPFSTFERAKLFRDEHCNEDFIMARFNAEKWLFNESVIYSAHDYKEYVG